MDEMSDFQTTALEMGTLVTHKNIAYGDAVNKTAKVLAILYDNGIQPQQYQDVLTVTRIVDKLCRIATNNDPFGEDPWSDINGYSLIRMVQRKKEKAQLENY